MMSNLGSAYVVTRTWLRIALLSVGSAVPLSAQQSHTTPQPHTAVDDALEAKADRPGGCFGGMHHVEPKPMRFFPSVALISADCIAEHGDTLYQIVGADSSGLVYLLDSPSSFAFLVRRHPPVFAADADYLEYVRDALVYRGELSPETALARNIDTLPDLPRGVRRKWRGYSPRMKAVSSNSREVEVLLYGPEGLTRASGSIAGNGKVFIYETERVWERPLRLTIN